MSELDSNEPLFQLLDYSLFLVQPLSDDPEPFITYTQNYNKQYGYFPIYFSCWMYDGMWHLGRGLEFAISLGKDYEIPEILNFYLKQVKFTGCDGTVVFDKESNLRKLIGYLILQARFNATDEVFNFQAAGSYNALSTPFFALPTIEWNDNEQYPSDIRPLYKNCAFEKYELGDYKYGNTIRYISGIIIAIY